MLQFDRVVVTGGAGRLGRFVLAELARAGHGVVALDPAPLGPPAPEGVEHIQASVLDLPALTRAFKGADAVLHLAALDWIAKAAGEDFIHVNVQGTWNVLQAAEAAGIARAVVTSSISATGIEELRPDWVPHYLAIDEAHEIRPVEPYSVSKEIVEKIALSFARRGTIKVACLRPMGVSVGASLPRFVKLAADTSKPWFNAYVTPEDNARCFRLALEADFGPFALAFVTAKDSTAEEPTLDLARRLWGRVPDVRTPQLYKSFPRASLCSGEAAKRHFGFEASSDWLKLRATVVD